MYNILINIKLIKDYDSLTNYQIKYLTTLFKLSELKINPSQIEVVKHYNFPITTLKDVRVKTIRGVIDTNLMDLYSDFTGDELFLIDEKRTLTLFFVTFMNSKGNLHKVFIPSSFLISEKTYKEIEYTKQSIYINYTNTDGVLDSISHRYNLSTSNVIFTNEINKNTRINFIQDKNYMIKLNLKKNTYTISKNNFVINPNIYREYLSSSSLFPLEHLFELFNVDRVKLKRSLEKISYITNRFVALGVGGTMGNFLYWIKQFQEYFDLPYVFKKLIIFEDDSMEFHNIFRIPLLLPNECGNIIRAIQKSYLALYNCRNITLDMRINNCLLLEYSRNFHQLQGSSIFIGTPDIATRQVLEQLNCKFFCPTHQNNTIKIVESPTIEGSLFYETYGNIDLNKFLLNMFNMSINLIYTLAENGKNPPEKNKLHFKQSFEEINFVENSKKSKLLKNIAYAIN